MMPPGPVAATADRSTPRSLASLRTGGLASTWADAPLGADGALAGLGGARGPLVAGWAGAAAGDADRVGWLAAAGAAGRAGAWGAAGGVGAAGRAGRDRAAAAGRPDGAARRGLA